MDDIALVTQPKANLSFLLQFCFDAGEQDGRGVGGRGVHLFHGYIRNTPSDTEVHAEHQLKVDRRA